MESIAGLRREEAARVERALRASPLIGPLLERWHEIGLPDCWLVAGALAQTLWNAAFGLPPCHGLADLDLVYFDPDDLSEETEARHARRLTELFSGLALRLDVKNEARVHLWYTGKFGYPIRPYLSTEDAITTFPTTATAIGVQPHGSKLRLCAPYGLSDLLNLIVRANKKQVTQTIYEAKVARWLTLWPELRVVPWDEPQDPAAG